MDQPLQLWNTYHLDREHAHGLTDLLCRVVEAFSKLTAAEEVPWLEFGYDCPHPVKLDGAMKAPSLRKRQSFNHALTEFIHERCGENKRAPSVK